MRRRRLLVSCAALLGGCVSSRPTGPRNPPTASDSPSAASESEQATPDASQQVVQHLNVAYRAIRDPLFDVDLVAYDAAVQSSAEGALATAREAATAAPDATASLSPFVELHATLVRAVETLHTVWTETTALYDRSVAVTDVSTALAPAREAAARVSTLSDDLRTHTVAIDTYPPALFLGAEQATRAVDLLATLADVLGSLLDAVAARLTADARWRRGLAFVDADAPDAARRQFDRARDDYGRTLDAVTSVTDSLVGALGATATYERCMADHGVTACETADEAIRTGVETARGATLLDRARETAGDCTPEW